MRKPSRFLFLVSAAYALTMHSSAVANPVTASAVEDELRICKPLIIDDIKNWIIGGQTILDWSGIVSRPIAANVYEYWSSWDTNAARAEKTFPLNTPILIKGPVDSVKKNEDGYYAQFAVGDYGVNFIDAFLGDGEAEKAASIVRGQSITLMCFRSATPYVQTDLFDCSDLSLVADIAYAASYDDQKKLAAGMDGAKIKYVNGFSQVLEVMKNCSVKTYHGLPLEPEMGRQCLSGVEK